MRITPAVTPLQTTFLENKLKIAGHEAQRSQKKIDALHGEIAELSAKLGYVLELKASAQDKPREIVAGPSKASESVAVVQASDWHLEETVDSAVVNRLNSFNLRTAARRIQNFFVNSLKLINLQRHGTDIHTKIGRAHV